ncbi:MAG: hypothetical protein JWO67_6126 [Streptosporangiaceae bacterium]|nr:hypothetical protein [Streptosporangiaceae bacterium]
MSGIHGLRIKRWRMDRPPLRTADEAASYIYDVGFALLFGDRGASLPALREAARDDDSPLLPTGWTEDIERIWTWKDELPLMGRAWVGRFVAARQSLVSPGLLALLRPGESEQALILGALSPTCRKVFERVEAEGPTSMRMIRQDFGLDSRASQRVLAELGQALLLTNYGTAQDGPGWPSCVIESTGRAFPAQDPRPAGERRRDAALLLLDTMVTADARQLARAFRWPRKEAAAVLAGLADEGRARPGADGAYRPC